MMNLIAAWNERDDHYAKRVRFVGPKRTKEAHPLTPREAQCVRWYRLTEADRLPPAERERAINSIRMWQPPYVDVPTGD